jgi:hypothetical protein
MVSIAQIFRRELGRHDHLRNVRWAVSKQYKISLANGRRVLHGMNCLITTVCLLVTGPDT